MVFDVTGSLDRRRDGRVGAGVEGWTPQAAC